MGIVSEGGGVELSLYEFVVGFSEEFFLMKRAIILRYQLLLLLLLSALL